ncbi:hypothetical protein ACWDUN_04000 [Mycobacterium sp. NPDC003323]
MPRVSGGGEVGVRIPGVYGRMQARERDLCGWPDPDISWADRQDHSQGCFVRPRRLLEALEAGQPVTVPKARVELVQYAVKGRRFHLPWDRSVQNVVVSPDDVVVPVSNL